MRKDSATIVFRTVLQSAADMEEPRERNSNLLPVKAKGLVRLRSVVSLGMSSTLPTPSFRTSCVRVL